MRDRVHLRTGDQVRIGSASFAFEFYEGEDVQVASSAISDLAVNDLKEKDLQQAALQFDGAPFNFTPSPSRGGDTTIQDTPSMLSRHYDPVMVADHLIGEIAGNAIQGNEDSQNWTHDLGKHEILGAIRDAQHHSLPRSQEPEKIHSPMLQSRSAILVWEDIDTAGSPTNDSLPDKNSFEDLHRGSATTFSKGAFTDVLAETEPAQEAPLDGLQELDVNNDGTLPGISVRSPTAVDRVLSKNEPAEQEFPEPMSRPSLVRQHPEQLYPLTGAIAASSGTSEDHPKQSSAQGGNGEDTDSFSDHARIERAENRSIEASTDAVILPQVDISHSESGKSGFPLLMTVSDDVSDQPAKDVAALSMTRTVAETEQKLPNLLTPSKFAAPSVKLIHSISAAMDDVCRTNEDAQAFMSGAEDTQESTRRRSDYLLKVAVGSRQPTSSQSDGLPTSDIDGVQPHSDDIHGPIEPITEARVGTGNGSEIRNSKRKKAGGDISDALTPVKAAKKRKIQDLSNSQDSNGSTIVVQMSAPKSARTGGSAKSRPASENVEAGSSAKSRTSVGSSQSSSAETKPRILFASSTNADTMQRCMNFLRKHGAVKVDSVQRCNILCVGKGKELKKTSKLIQAIASGIDIVTDEWIFQSVSDGRLLDPAAFYAEDPEREAEWGVTLTEAIARGKQGRKPFDGWTVLFTSTLRKELGKGFTELKDIAMHAGAKTVRAATPQKMPKEMTQTLLLAAEADDVSVLQENGWKCYSKDILTLSVLRGVLEPESAEFLLPLNEAS